MHARGTDMGREDIVRRVLSQARDRACDTAVGRAFLLAAGAVPAGRARRASVAADRYRGVRECMAQRTGVRL